MIKSTDVLNFVLPASHYTLSRGTYGPDPRQGWDLYLPHEVTGVPLVFVYGGAWREGERADYEFVGHALSGLGHPVFIPDYRLYPAVRYPDFVDDVAASIAWFEANAVALTGAPLSRYVLMGHSSGAHTAALLATDTAFLAAHGVSAELSGLIGLAGPYELPLDDPEVSDVFAQAPAQAVQPPLRVSGAEPPVLLLHGLNDERVVPRHSRRFADALAEAGVPVTLHLYPRVNHVRIIAGLAAPLRFLNDSYADTAEFLRQHAGRDL
ncbi:alpha/beta hydrolase [Granulosicoccaceae sp. 1_MG-2023]|nr:alpha/beta hydrolase [Granulosicoccaceae sp. 1_MG-2023]